MFYRTDEDHGLAHNPFNALVVPRPIGWISTLDEDGRANLAPYSFFNAVAYEPPQVMFAASSGHAFGGLKDSVQNARETGEFVVNLATWAQREQMNASAVPAPRHIDEFDYAGLEKAPSMLVKPHRVMGSPAQLECVCLQTVELAGEANTAVFGQVLGVHIGDRFIVDGLVDTVAMEPIGRLGYLDYAKVEKRFIMERPEWPDDDK